MSEKKLVKVTVRAKTIEEANKIIKEQFPDIEIIHSWVVKPPEQLKLF